LTAVIHRTKAIPSYEKGNGKVEKTPPISNKLLRADPKNTGQQRMPPLTEVEQNLQAHMIEKQRLAESDLLSSLYRVLIENHDLPSGLRAALQIVCQITGWVVGTAWLPSDNERQIRFYSSWHQDDPKLAEFIGLCQQQSFARDLGIPGRVWPHGKDE
jgi:adenylate cyclase